MNHCLRIPEIVSEICNALDERSALSMALTCKAFLEPALDQLWRRLTSFEPLAACLPDGLLRGEEKEAFLASGKETLRVMVRCSYPRLYVYG